MTPSCRRRSCASPMCATKVVINAVLRCITVGDRSCRRPYRQLVAHFFGELWKRFSLCSFLYFALASHHFLLYYISFDSPSVSLPSAFPSSFLPLFATCLFHTTVSSYIFSLQHRQHLCSSDPASLQLLPRHTQFPAHVSGQRGLRAPVSTRGRLPGESEHRLPGAEHRLRIRLQRFRIYRKTRADCHQEPVLRQQRGS